MLTVTSWARLSALLDDARLPLLEIHEHIAIFTYKLQHIHSNDQFLVATCVISQLAHTIIDPDIRWVTMQLLTCMLMPK